MRNRIGRIFNKIKHSRRVATRYGKLASNSLGFVHCVGKIVSIFDCCAAEHHGKQSVNCRA